jgi:transcription antitermination factor NusG
LTDKLFRIGEVPGVIGVVRSTDREPFRIAHEAVQAILDKTDPSGAIHEIPASRVKYGPLRGKRGDTVQFAENNPLWNLVATIADVDGENITAILGRLKVRLKSDHIGKLDNRGTTDQLAD